MNVDLNLPELMWTPTETSGKQLKRLQKLIEEKYEVEFGHFWEFYEWTIDHLSEFWAEMWDFLGVISSKRFEKVIDLDLPISSLPEWFIGAKLNYAENLLKYRDNHTALIVTGEDREPEFLTYSELFKEAELYSSAFRKTGLRKGDVVACFMSNRKEAILAMLGTCSIGGIWTGSLPLMGAKAVLSRLKQVKPKILITVDRFLREGVEIDMFPKVQDIVEGLASVEKVIVVTTKIKSRNRMIDGIPRSTSLDDFLLAGRNADGTIPPIEFEQLSLSEPVAISYTSGTTGLPKPVVHGCGILLGISNNQMLYPDSDRRAIWLSVSPVGWGSWTFNVISLFLGQTVILHEGWPFFLSPTYLWDMIDHYKISHLLLPSNTIDDLYRKNFAPTKDHSLSSLKYVIIGGCRVMTASIDFIYEHLKDIFFAHSYGFTEIAGGCNMSCPALPQYKDEISAPCLGFQVEVVNEDGKPVFGEIGDIVVSKSVPSFPLSGLGDENMEAFQEKYMRKHPGMFTSGDYGFINPNTKGLVICCRSDETLKQRGCRFGSSEIYNVVDVFPEILDSVCVSQYNQQLEERAVLFLKIREGYSYSEELVNRIRKAIESELTKRHVPDVIIETMEIPYNLNDKKMEIIVKKIINNMPHNPETVRNPECLQSFMNIPELQGF